MLKPLRQAYGPAEASMPLGSALRRAASLRRRLFAAALFAFALTGATLAMTATADAGSPKNAWPLRFKSHSFAEYCYNTQKCLVIYGKLSFANYANKPSPPPLPNEKANWYAGYSGISNFPPPAEVTWTSLDGTEHHALVDIGAIFEDELALHHLTESEVAEGLYVQGLVDPDIFLEVNDRMINIYMKSDVSTKAEQIPGNTYSYHRSELILAWSHIY